MKYIYSLLATTLLVVVFSGAGIFVAKPMVVAEDLLNDVCSQVTGPEKPSTCETDGKDPLTKKDGGNGLLLKVASLIVYITGIAAVIGVIFGGFKYILSNGDSNAINSAKNTILYSLVGLAVAALALVIVQYVIVKLID
jgi:hypothetical protein